MKKKIDLRTLVGKMIIDKYRIDRYLDAGAFGAVFQATHIAYGVELREVAIKIAKRRLNDIETRQIFGDALLMAKITDSIDFHDINRCFVTVHDAGKCPVNSPLPGHPYMVMEFIRGKSLAAYIRKRAFPLKRATEYFDLILKAVAHMHVGIKTADGKHYPMIHRDLKPSNILVTRRKGKDEIKITDFGLAIELSSRMQWVDSGGTLCFMAPESFTHDISSTKTDVYMLGLIFYEMLTGVNPFSDIGNHIRGSDDSKNDELHKLHLNARHLERFLLLEKHEEMRHHPDLIQVIKTSLSPEMSGRFRDANEMLLAWEKAKSEGTPHKQNEKPWDIVNKFCEQAEQSIAVKDWVHAYEQICIAMKINRDCSTITDQMMNAKAYHIMVKCLLHQNNTDEAGIIATEGLNRKECKETCLAVAEYYESKKSVVAASFYEKALSF